MARTPAGVGRAARLAGDKPATIPASRAQEMADGGYTVPEILLSLSGWRSFPRAAIGSGNRYRVPSPTVAVLGRTAAGRELCAFACVFIHKGAQNPTGPATRFPESWCRARQSTVPGPHETLAVASCVDP